jgi:Surface antigen variable number repeat
LKDLAFAMPIVRGIYFEPIKSVPPTLYPMLLKRLEQIGLFADESYNQKKGDEAKEAIEHAYMQRGIAVRVDEQVNAILPDSVTLTFIISRQ